MEASNGHPDEQTHGLDLASNENSSQIDVTSLPSFQSIQEMGYQSHIIRRAFDLVKRTKGKSILAILRKMQDFLSMKPFCCLQQLNKAVFFSKNSLRVLLLCDRDSGIIKMTFTKS